MKSFFGNLTVVIIVLVIFGYLRWQPEEKFNQELRQDELLPDPIDWEDRNSMGQAGFAAALGGLRPVLASYYYLRAHNLHVYRDWYEMEKALQTTTTLQPKSDFYWEMAGWQLANNTSSIERENRKVEPVERERRRVEYIKRGDEFYKKGIEKNPESYDLHAARQLLATDSFRIPDYDEAIKVGSSLLKLDNLTRSSKLLGWGNYVYALASVEGNEAEAYQEALKLWNYSYPGERVPVLKSLIYTLENQLMVPQAKRMSSEALFLDVENVYENLRSLSETLHKIETNTKIQNVALLNELNFEWQRKSKDMTRMPDNFLRAKIFAIQNRIEPYLQKVKYQDLVYSEDHKKYIESLSSLNQYMLEAGDYTILRDKLLENYSAGEATRFEKLMLFFVHYNLLQSRENHEVINEKNLLYHEEMKYNRLKTYWNHINQMRQKAVSRHTPTMKFMPTTGLVSELLELEKKFNIPKAQRIKLQNIYTGSPF